MGRTTDWLLALSGGLLLALMINYNSMLARQSTPLFASWVAHGIGAFAALFFVALFSKPVLAVDKDNKTQPMKMKSWIYLGGIPGALTVVLAAITVNSSIGFSGSLALMLVGQVIFGVLSDLFGLFGTPQRRLKMFDFFIMLSVLTGSWIIIFFRV